MINQAKTRAERREEERASKKDYAVLTKSIRAAVAGRSDAEFKLAVLQALQHLDSEKHDNNVVAATLIDGCVDCAGRGDMASAKLLLYLSGALVNPTLTRFMLNTVMEVNHSFQMSPPPHKPMSSE